MIRILLKSKKIVFLIFLFSLFYVSNAHSSTKDVRRLNSVLSHSPMKGTGKIIVAQSRKYGINPYFVAAVAKKESSLGATSCSDNPKNVWGLGACGRAWTPPYFQTWVQAVNYFIRFIDSRWPNATSPFQFDGYCRGCEYEWGTAVAYHMRSMGGSSSVR